MATPTTAARDRSLNPRPIVALHDSGSFDVQGWINPVPALLDAWFPGQYGGQALAEVLFGDVNPSGKLPITWEKRLKDNPAYASLPAPDAPNTMCRRTRGTSHAVFTEFWWAPWIDCADHRRHGPPGSLPKPLKFQRLEAIQSALGYTLMVPASALPG